ncbi:mCG146975 [Mus musculus]|nr:mCG146975 [Mus musculus]
MNTFYFQNKQPMNTKPIFHKMCMNQPMVFTQENNQCFLERINLEVEASQFILLKQMQT